jgi:hypothetical protein
MIKCEICDKPGRNFTAKGTLCNRHFKKYQQLAAKSMLDKIGLKTAEVREVCLQALSTNDPSWDRNIRARV